MDELVTLSELILGEGITMTMFVVFLSFGIVGLITSLLFDVYSSGTTTKKFNLKYWWRCNRLRIAISIITIIIGIIFSEQLLGIQMSNWAGFLAGFTADKLIENLLQRKRRKVQEENKDKILKN